MKHHKSIRQFGRVRKQRIALMSGLAGSLLTHGKIKTTEAKAKELRPMVEKMITKTKKSKSPHQASSRTGGYTRIVKTGRRTSDGSKMAIIEIIS